MAIAEDAFYLVTVDEEWVNGCFHRLGVADEASSIQTLGSSAFKPRGVAFDGTRFWTADPNNDALVSFTLDEVTSTA